MQYFWFPPMDLMFSQSWAKQVWAWQNCLPSSLFSGHWRYGPNNTPHWCFRHRPDDKKKKLSQKLKNCKTFKLKTRMYKYVRIFNLGPWSSDIYFNVNAGIKPELWILPGEWLWAISAQFWLNPHFGNGRTPFIHLKYI